MGLRLHGLVIWFVALIIMGSDTFCLCLLAPSLSRSCDSIQVAGGDIEQEVEAGVDGGQTSVAAVNSVVLNAQAAADGGGGAPAAAPALAMAANQVGKPLRESMRSG